MPNTPSKSQRTMEEGKGDEGRSPKKMRLEASLTERHPDMEAVATRCSEPWSRDADGKFSYFDYTHAWMKTEDIAATTEFYVRTLGFKLLFRYGEYWVEVMGPGGVMLGFEAAPGSKAEAKDGIIIGLGVSDHAATTAVLKARGVQVSDPVKHGDMLLRTFEDPNGYTCQLLSSTEGEESKAGAWDGDKQLGFTTYGNVQLSCEDIAATADFYVNKLGCTESSRFGDMWLEIKVPGDMTLGFLAVPGAKAQKKSGYRIGFGSSNLGPMKSLQMQDIDGTPLHVVAKMEHVGDLNVPHPDCGAARRMAAMKPYTVDAKLGYTTQTTLWLASDDFEATADFYVHKLGWKLAARWDGMWLEVVGPANLSIGFVPRKSSVPRPKDMGFDVTMGVANLAASVKALKARGVETFEESSETKGPVEVHGFRDPDGFHLYLLAMAATPDEKEEEGKTEAKAKEEGTSDSSNDHTTPWGEPDVGLTCYSNITMFTKDLQSTKDFLTSKLGLKCEMLYEGLWLEMIAPGGVHLGFDPVTEERNKSDFDICIACSSLDATRAELKKRGVEFDGEPARFGPSTLHRFHDNMGNRFVVCAPDAKKKC